MTPVVVPIPAEVCPGYEVYPELDPDYSNCQWDIGGEIYSPGDLGQVIADNPPGSHYGMVLQEVEFERGN